MSTVKTIGVAIRELLQADSDVTALVGGRIGPAPLRGPGEPKITLPAITYQRLGSTRPQHFEGRSHPTATRIQVDCWADDHDEAETVFDAVRVALDMKTSVFEHQIQKIQIVDGSDQFIPEPDTELYRFTADYLVHHAEAAPKQ
jgi:hypothetical protein